MKRYHAKTSLLLILLSCMAVSRAHAGFVWNELGDAGDSLEFANETTGVGDLDAIVGTLPDSGDINNVDIFALQIKDTSLFSATTDNFETGLFESWLYLFNDAGVGVAASASTDGGTPGLATISFGSVSGDKGLYYLAVARFATTPNSDTGAIFPDPFSNSSLGEVLSPTGPGGAGPLSGWSTVSTTEFAPAYRIDLTGATAATAVPEPVSAAVWTVGILIGLRRRCRKTNSASNHGVC